MKRILGIISIGLLIFVLTGCLKLVFAKEQIREQAEKQSTIIITGSTSVEKIINSIKSEYEALYPGSVIQYSGSGSSAGIADTKAGINDIGASSRDLKEEEQEPGLTTVTFAYEGIAVIVHPSNTVVSDLTKEQLADIYSGKITDWSEVGGEQGDIFVISREESSGTRTAFEDLVYLKAAGALTGNAAVLEGNGSVQAVVAGNESAIGYVSFSYVNDTVKLLSIDGKEATVENAASGIYPLCRPFLFCYYEQSLEEAEREFLEFVLSPQGQDIVEQHDAIRVD